MTAERFRLLQQQIGAINTVSKAARLRLNRRLAKKRHAPPQAQGHKISMPKPVALVA